MTSSIDKSRRQILALTGQAGLTTLTAQAIGVNLGLVGVAAAQSANVSPFRFAIIADPHLYSPKDHVFDKQLEDAVTQVNGLPQQPDFVMIMGDVAHHGEKDQMEKGKRILSSSESADPLDPRRARLVPRHGRGLEGCLRRRELVLRPQGGALHRIEFDPGARLLDRGRPDASAAARLVHAAEQPRSGLVGRRRGGARLARPRTWRSCRRARRSSSSRIHRCGTTTRAGTSRSRTRSRSARC